MKKKRINTKIRSKNKSKNSSRHLRVKNPPIEVLEEYYGPKTRLKKILKIFLFIVIEIIIIIAIIYLFIYLFRTISSKQIDDISPEIPCEKSLLAKADVYYVIPKFHNISIADDPEWCRYVSSLNKTLRMHGVTHEYNEFNYTRDDAYLQEGMEIFKKCFGYYPTNFRPPQLAINKENLELLKRNHLKLDYYESTNFHKVYHCMDTGLEKNNKVDII